MPAVPPFILRKLYVEGSLRNEEGGFALELKNTIAPATIVRFIGLDLDGQPVGASQVTLVPSRGNPRSMEQVSDKAPLSFPIGATITLRVTGMTLEPGFHELSIHVTVKEVGPLDIPVSDTVG